MDSIFNIESEELYEQSVIDVVRSYYSSAPQAVENAARITSAKEDIKKLIITSHFDLRKFPQLLVDKGWNKKREAFFLGLLEEKKTELLYATLLSVNSEYGESVISFDWILTLVMGTSELNRLKYPLLQLILSTDNNGTRRKVMYDMNKDILLKTIASLEKLDKTK